MLSGDDMKRCVVFQVVFNFVLFETFDVVDNFMPAADALWLLICCHQVRDFSDGFRATNFRAASLPLPFVIKIVPYNIDFTQSSTCARLDISHSICDTMLPLKLNFIFASFQEEYAKLVKNLLVSQTEPILHQRLVDSFNKLTPADVDISIEKASKEKFRKNLDSFLADVKGLLCVR